MKRIVILALLAATFVGCERKQEPPKPEVYPAGDNAYMKDPAFRKQCDESVKLRNHLLTERQKIVNRRQAVLDRYRGDEAKAAKDPEWAKLATELKIADKKIVDRDIAARDLVRNRMLQAAEDTKRIAAGQAVPKK